MNTLFISPNSPYESVGGIERYLLNLIDYYKDRQGSKTFVVLPTTGKKHIETVKNVKIYFEDSLSLSSVSSQREITNKAWKFSGFIKQLIKGNGIEVICAENAHLGLPPAYSLLLNMISLQYKIPLVLRVHSFASTTLQVEIINQLTWNLISCVSKSVAGDCFNKGADINRLSTDYLGVNTQKFNISSVSREKFSKGLGISPNDKVILTASRIILGRKNILKEKGFINLIESFSKISPKYPKLYLLIATGTPPKHLEKEFKEAQDMLHGYLKLHNVLGKSIVKTFSLEEMPNAYCNSDVFVLPSENETFGQVFIESMACGLPVIGTNVGGIPEIISDSQNGYLIPPNDSSLLAQRIEILLNDLVLREKFVNTARDTVNRCFTSEIQFSNFDEKLVSLVSKDKLTPDII